MHRILSGRNPENTLVEIVEILDHPWFVGCQFHPEFKSKPMDPHPLFRDFIAASIDYREKNTGRTCLKKPLDGVITVSESLLRYEVIDALYRNCCWAED
ncbi:MAG TPA: hypothetical protein ENN34_13885 [Deltaproteobacteria bacterium]|nr:hypothetical protein [Deltaproteobacteria bacterium]